MGSYTSYTYVTIGDEVLDSANYTLNCATGEITIPGKYVTGDIRIKTIPRIHPYTVTFDPNGGTGTQTPMLVFRTGTVMTMKSHPQRPMPTSVRRSVPLRRRTARSLPNGAAVRRLPPA